LMWSFLRVMSEDYYDDDDDDDARLPYSLFEPQVRNRFLC
jgi:hypothetical protein